MKRLIFISILLLVGLSLFSQGRFPFSRSIPVESGGGDRPSHYSTDVIAEYIFNDTYVYSSGDPELFDSIVDASGNGYNLKAISPTQEYESGADTGLYFSGAADRLTDTIPVINSTVTVYIVVKIHEWENDDHIIGGAISNTMRFRCDTSTPNAQLYNGNGPIGDLALDLYDPAIYRVELNGASSSISMNDGTPVTGDAGTDDPDGISIGGRADGNQYIKATYFYVVILNGTESESEEDSSWSYINSLYSIY